MAAPVPATLCPLSLTYVIDLFGKPIVGALLTVFQAGTTTPAVAFADAALTSPLQQPVKTTGSGRFPNIYVGSGYFRYRVTNPDGVIVDDLDGVEGAVVTQVTNNITDTGSQTPTAALTHFYGTDTPAGWVRANGKTIGNAVSGATEFADPSTQALFVQLWGADPNLAVSGGRGNTAIEDYNQGKAIALPDLRRVAMIGLDGMGNGFLVPNAPTDPRRTLGLTFGEEVHTLSIAEMPTHSHVMSCDVEGGHIHSAACDLQGIHSHGANTDSQGLHTHSAGMDTQGQHSHAAGMDVQGAHQHSVTYYLSSYSAYGNGTNTGPSVYGQTVTNPNGVTNVTGDHQHNITVQPDGAHLHNITIQNNGQHVHNVTVTAAGQHQHNITIADAGEHSHVVVAGPTGGSAAHNNMQPSMPVTVLIKL